MKLSAISEKFQKIEEAAKIREEVNLNFSKQAEQKLQSKMESNKENRTILMNQMLERLKKTVIYSLLNNSIYLSIFAIQLLFQIKCELQIGCQDCYDSWHEQQDSGRVGGEDQEQAHLGRGESSRETQLVSRKAQGARKIDSQFPNTYLFLSNLIIKLK